MMKQKIGVIEWCMRYNRIVFLLTTFLIVLGCVGLWLMPKQEFPVFTIRQGVVIGVYPGATSAQVEEQLAKPLERFIYTFNEVKKEKSYTLSQDGRVIMMVELNDNVNNKDEVWSKIKHGLTLFKMKLPAGVLALIANDDFGDTSALLITLESKDKTYRELKQYLESLEDKLRGIKEGSKIRHYGLRQEQVTIYLDKEKMAQYGLNNNLIFAQLFMQDFTTSGGSVNNGDTEIPIYVTQRYHEENEIAEQIIYSDPNGNIVRLKDVATIKREYDEPDNYVTNNGVKALVLSLEMRNGYNIVSYGEKVEKIISEFEQTLPSDVKIRRIADQPKVVNESVTSFLRDLLLSIVIVILVMIVLFPLRSAIVAAISIPVSIFISIGIMYITGIPLNTVTLAALIVVLGMIVDNSIVVIDGYLEYLDKGMSRWHAAIKSGKTYFASIFLATLCISVIFYPLLFTMTGQFHDFLRFFPWTITISLMTSLVVAMLLVPYMEFGIIKKGLKDKTDKKKGKNLLDFVQQGYEWILNLTFRFPRLTLLFGASTIVLSAWLFTKLNISMMPKADRNQFAVEIYLPTGTALEKTGAVADSVYQLLKKEQQVESVTQFIGSGSPRFQATYAPNFPSKHYAQFIVNTTSNEATIALLDKYTNNYATYFPGAYVRFKQMDYNNVNFPIEIRFSGEELDQLKLSANYLMDELKQMDELTYVHTNFEEQLTSINVVPDPIKSAQVNVNRTALETGLALKYKGLRAGTLWEGDYPVNIMLKYAPGLYPNHFDQVKNEYVCTHLPHKSIPLRQIADVKYAKNEGQIVRRSGVRTISVLADVRRGFNPNNVFKKVDQVMVDKVVKQLPSGVDWEQGGTVEHDAETVPPIMRGLAISVFIIFMFLLFNFKKISIASTALGSISLCLLGAVGGLWLADVDFGITSILGVVSLMGIIVRNAIIMFEHAEELHQNKHLSAKEAAYDAGKRRMLPIFLTSATTAVGVVPMIISKSALWMPMGIVICTGTILSMFLVVTILPVMYWKIYTKDN